MIGRWSCRAANRPRSLAVATIRFERGRCGRLIAIELALAVSLSFCADAPVVNARILAELRHLARLGFPIVVTQLSQSLMQLTDVYLVSPLGPKALGAAGLGGNVYFGCAFTIASVLLCL